MEPPDPPRKNYDFKEREFKRDNVVVPGQAPMPTAKELAIMAGPVVATAKNSTTPKADDPNDVYAVLQENRAVEKKLGLNQVELKEIKSRKKRDYWLLLISSEVLFGAVTYLGRGNAIMFVCGLAGMVMIGVGLTWIMWQIMDRY